MGPLAVAYWFLRGSEYFASAILLTTVTAGCLVLLRKNSPSYFWWAVPGWFLCLAPMTFAAIFRFHVSTPVGGLVMRLTEIMFYCVPIYGLVLLIVKPRQWYLTIPVAALQTAIALVCTFAITCSSGQGCL